MNTGQRSGVISRISLIRLAHDRESNRVEIFKIERCKELPNGTKQWVDDESRNRYYGTWVLCRTP
ncbi:hypothetical protein Taro_008397 [Colocasia esculenta]|uniref:Uncharacterized protein n=1 Tax=Colocasia esculenta TaxID=4460 RepID=A0A843U1R1_COLES|nr:hypothetical protein [Colocasia esculenta]